MSNAPDIEFGELPSSSRRERWSAPVIAALKERPGEWAKVRTCASRTQAGTTAQNLRGQGLEASSRGCDVWARWPEGGAA